MGSTTGSIIITVKGKEVYVGTAPPSSPVDNELWLDISENNVLKYYKASTKTWCVVNDVSEKFGDVYKYLQTNYYTKTETNSAVKEEIGKTTIIKKDGTVVNMKDAINSVIDTATEHTQKIEDINSKYNSVTGEITEVKTITSEIKQDLNGFKTTVSENYVDKTEFNNLQIGGTNLIRGTHKTAVTYSYPASGYADGFRATTTIPLNGDTYTLSFWAKSTVDGDKITIHFYNYDYDVISLDGSQGQHSTANPDGRCDFILSTVLTKYWVTYTIPKNSNSTKNVIIPRLWSDYGTGEVTVQWEKLEEGNKATDWSPAPEDIETEITSVETIATQTANKFNWLVKSGTSATDFTLTDRTATLVSDYINLKGLVTFSGLNSDAQNKINTANTTANSANTKAQDIIDNIYIKGTTTINGGRIDTDSLFAQNITATGTITGLTLRGTQLYTNEGEIAGLTIKDNSLYHRWYDSVQNGASITHFYFDDMGISSLFKEGSKKLWIGAHPKIYSADHLDSDGKVMEENMEYPFYVTGQGYLLSKTGNIAGYDFNSDGFYSPFTTSSRKTQRFAIKSNAKYTEPGTPFIGLQDENEAFKWFYVKTDGSGYFTNLEVSEDIQSTGNVIADGDIIAGLGTSNQVSVQGLANNKVNKSDIVNNLSTSSTDKPLSAYQGKVLNNSINSVNSKINAMQGKCFLAINENSSSNRTSSNVVIKSTSINLTAGNYIAIASAVIQTSRYTSNIRLNVDGKDIGMGVTNSTTPTRVSVMGHFEITSSKKTNIILKAFGQDNGTAVTVKAYDSYSIIVFKIG